MGKTAKTAIKMNLKDRAIKYTQSGIKDLDHIVPLWLKLRAHHKERSVHFKDDFDTVTWEMRKKRLLEKSAKGELLVHLARDKGTLIGYCVSSVDSEKQGEIESIYIEKEYRKRGIGDDLMKTALNWMDDRGVQTKIIGVAVGNEEAFGFYEKYGFFPRVTVLRQKEKTN
jgi:diamine N-acetyltransferase